MAPNKVKFTFTDNFTLATSRTLNLASTEEVKNKMPGRTPGFKTKKLKGAKKVHNNELHNFYTRVMK
jgi:hypothetical protein